MEDAWDVDDQLDDEDEEAFNVIVGGKKFQIDKDTDEVVDWETFETVGHWEAGVRGHPLAKANPKGEDYGSVGEIAGKGRIKFFKTWKHLGVTPEQKYSLSFKSQKPRPAPADFSKEVSHIPRLFTKKEKKYLGPSFSKASLRKREDWEMNMDTSHMAPTEPYRSTFSENYKAPVMNAVWTAPYANVPI
jgi:hypothetical protein